MGRSGLAERRVVDPGDVRYAYSRWRRVMRGHAWLVGRGDGDGVGEADRLGAQTSSPPLTAGQPRSAQPLPPAATSGVTAARRVIESRLGACARRGPRRNVGGPGASRGPCWRPWREKQRNIASLARRRPRPWLGRAAGEP